jgi:outer membrane protein OmpA-like peptidoglycan-associated protein
VFVLSCKLVNLFDKMAPAIHTKHMLHSYTFALKINLIILLVSSLIGCSSIQSALPKSANPLADDDISKDLDYVCERAKPETILKTVEVPAQVSEPVIIKPSDKDGDGVYDENDHCPNTEEAKKVDQRGCPAILLTMHGINFNTDSSKILPDSESLLAQAKAALQDSVGVSVIIEGHTDNTAGYSYNQLLSERRAKAVMEFLVANGIEKERLISVGKGENSPVSTNNTKEGRYQNRRVELRTVGTAFIKQEK